MKLPDPDHVRRLEAEKLVHVDSMDDLILANYTNECQHGNHWDDATRACRGLILRVDKAWPDSTCWTEVVALPFEKFYSYGERFPSSPLVEVSEKADGMLGVLLRYDVGLRVASRGRFKSEPALWMTHYLNSHFDLSALPVSYTLLFELIAPQFRIVVDYGTREDLVLIGVRDRYSGADFSMARVWEIGKQYGFSTPEMFVGSSIEQLLVEAKKLPANFEGWVMRFADGQRLKIKGDAYKALARAIQDINPKAVLEALMRGQYQGLLDGVPEEFRSAVREWGSGYIADMLAILTHVHELIAEAPKTSRKDLAVWVKDHEPGLLSEVMLVYDKRDPAPVIYRKMLEAL